MPRFTAAAVSPTSIIAVHRTFLAREFSTPHISPRNDSASAYHEYVAIVFGCSSKPTTRSFIRPLIKELEGRKHICSTGAALTTMDVALDARISTLQASFHTHLSPGDGQPSTFDEFRSCFSNDGATRASMLYGYPWLCTGCLTVGTQNMSSEIFETVNQNVGTRDVLRIVDAQCRAGQHSATDATPV
jgi:hypothetical protein